MNSFPVIYSFNYYLSAWLYQQKFLPTYVIQKKGQGIDAEYYLIPPIN